MPVKSVLSAMLPAVTSVNTPAFVMVFTPFAVRVHTKRFWFAAGWDSVTARRVSLASVNSVVSPLADVPAPVPQAPNQFVGAEAVPS